MRQRTSIIWTVSDQEFTKVIKQSDTMTDVLRYFGLQNKGNNYKTARKRIEALLGKELGVTDNSIRRMCKQIGIPLPNRGRGFWT